MAAGAPQPQARAHPYQQSTQRSDPNGLIWVLDILKNLAKGGYQGTTYQKSQYKQQTPTSFMMARGSSVLNGRGTHHQMKGCGHNATDSCNSTIGKQHHGGG
jgi:dipeptidase